jgi:CRP/FNR family cyclic AMP-dependent transcriptional regulator
MSEGEPAFGVAGLGRPSWLAVSLPPLTRRLSAVAASSARHDPRSGFPWPLRGDILRAMSPTDQKLDLLRTVPLFGSFGRREIRRVGTLTDEVDLPLGRVLMRQGDVGHEAFIIVRGTATVERDGRQIAERGDGDIVGEMALLSELPRSCTVTLTAPSRLLVIGHRDFHSLMDEMPAVRLSVLDTLARRLRELEPDAAH